MNQNNNASMVEDGKPTDLETVNIESKELAAKADDEFALLRSNMAFSTEVLDQMENAGIAGGRAEAETQSFKDQCLDAGFYARDMIGSKGLGVDSESVEGQAADNRYTALIRMAYRGHAIAGAELDANSSGYKGKQREEFIQSELERKLELLEKYQAKFAIVDIAKSMVQDLLEKSKDTVVYARRCVQKQEDINNGVVKEKPKPKTRLEKVDVVKALWTSWLEDADHVDAQSAGEDLLESIDLAIEAGFFLDPEKTKKTKKKS